MNVSAADILTVTTMLWGTYEPTESFASMAKRIVAERPTDWQKLMRLSETLRDASGGLVHDYAAQAAALRAALEK